MRYVYTMIARYKDSNEIAIETYSSRAKQKKAFKIACKQHELEKLNDTYAWCEDEDKTKSQFSSVELFKTEVR